MAHIVYVRLLPCMEPSRGTLHRAGRELLSALLKEDFGTAPEELMIASGPHGKPFAADRPDICWNISHSGRTCAVIAAGIPVGLDLEEVREADWRKLGRRILTSDEYGRLLNDPDPLRRFFRLWTRRESYVKWSGEGMSRDFRTLPEDGWDIDLTIGEDCPMSVHAAVPLQLKVEERTLALS